MGLCVRINLHFYVIPTLFACFFPYNFLHFNVLFSCNNNNINNNNTLHFLFVDLTLRLLLLLAIEDVHGVYGEVHTLSAQWSDICFALKLPISHEATIRSETHGENSARCLRMVLTKWLQKSYNVDRYGPPTWRMLVKAVGSPVGGKNYALAETIAKAHPGMP